MSNINIVQLIERHPLTCLSENYYGRLINKIKEGFNNEEHKLFVSNFYCYLKYDKHSDFIIDLDTLWKWLDFSNKENAFRLLKKHFEVDTDYKCLLVPKDEQKSGRGGHNVNKIMLTVKTFKSFCLKAGTKKADKIHDYYLKLEEMIQEIVNEESNELRLKLENKTFQLENVILTTQNEKFIIREKTILDHFPVNVQCVYYGYIDNTNDEGEKLIKFGNSNCLYDRVESHKKTFENFHLTNAFRVENKFQIENAIKKNSVLKKRRRSIIIENTKHTELLAIDGISLEELDKVIKDIIRNIEYTPENYKKLLDKNDALFEKNITLEEEISRLKTENLKLIKKYNPKEIPNVVKDSESYNIINSIKRITKRSDGFYYIAGSKYSKCFGTREEVWSAVAYKTSGGLTKSNLMCNKNGEIVSKKKSDFETVYNRVEKMNSNK
jgi:hypothetical protein